MEIVLDYVAVKKIQFFAAEELFFLNDSVNFQKLKSLLHFKRIMINRMALFSKLRKTHTKKIMPHSWKKQ